VAGREDIARDREVDRVDRRREHLARTVRAWEAESLAFHCHQWLFQRAYRGADLLIKKVKRVGHGFRNFTNYRLRLLLHCGVRWQTHRTARLRGRSPRLVA
jgi:transposase